MRLVKYGFFLLAAACVAYLLIFRLPLWVSRSPETIMPAPSASRIEMEVFTLSNGMEVIVLPNDRVPAVSHMLWLRVGAADDPLGQSGLAHYHEHLMFKGTPTVAAGEYSRRLEALGGEFNAFTGADFTGYYVNIAKEHLEQVMQLESDRMQHLTPSDEDYAKEREVIIEERQSRIGNQPAAQLAEQMRAALFLHHPYRIPIIGWMHEMKGLTAQAAKQFYETYYQAANMVLIIAGDVTAQEVKPLAEEYYGGIVTREANQHDWVQEPPAIAPRRVILRHVEVKQPIWRRYYQAPSYGEGDSTKVMALDLLSEWLGGGRTSLLYETLVKDKKLAVSVSTGYSGMSRGPAVFSLSATPAENVSLGVLEEAIEEVIAKVKHQPIAIADLQRIRTLYKASVIYARDSLSAIAHFVGYVRMLNLPLEFIHEWEARIMEITPLQIQQAAQEVLVEDASVTGQLLPEKSMMADREEEDAP